MKKTNHEKNISKLYEMSSAYIGGSEEIKCEQIVEFACSVLANDPRFTSLYNVAVNCTEEMVYDVCEEISGTLGEYFDN